VHHRPHDRDRRNPGGAGVVPAPERDVRVLGSRSSAWGSDRAEAVTP
jgi:hypothetical protein